MIEPHDSKVNRALEHVLRSVAAKCWESHVEHDEEEFCHLCQIVKATFAAVADFWEKNPNDELADHVASTAARTQAHS